jgi:hypothetical protein
MFDRLKALYEEKKLYRFNPCDVDAFKFLQAYARALESLTSQCPCCNGARIVVAIVAAYWFPQATLGFIAGYIGMSTLFNWVDISAVSQTITRDKDTQPTREQDKDTQPAREKDTL